MSIEDIKNICDRLNGKDVAYCKKLIDDHCIPPVVNACEARHAKGSEAFDRCTTENFDLTIGHPKTYQTFHPKNLTACAQSAYDLVKYYGAVKSATVSPPPPPSTPSPPDSPSEEEEEEEPQAPSPEEPDGKQWKLALDYNLLVPISTSVSEGGLGHAFNLSYSIGNNSATYHSFMLGALFGKTNGKLYASTDVPGSSTENSHWGIMAGMGRTKYLSRYFFSSTSSLIGIDTTSSAQPDRTVGGETFSFDASKKLLFNIKTQYGAGLELRPSSNFILQLAPSLGIGALFDSPGSEWNRLPIEFMLRLSLGYGSGEPVFGSRPRKPTPMELAYYTFARLHGTAQTILVNKTLSEEAEKAGAFVGGGGDPGSMEDIRFLTGLSAFLAGFGLANSRKAYVSFEEYNYFPLVLEIASGILVLGLAGNNSGRGTGGAYLLNAGDMLTYRLMDIDKAGGRERAGEDLHFKLQKAALINAAIKTGLFLIGGLVLYKSSQNDAGLILTSSALQANQGLAIAADPTDSGAVESTIINYIPATRYYRKSKMPNAVNPEELTESRAGISVMSNFEYWFAQMRFLSHALRADNIGKRAGAAPDEPYGAAMAPTEISVTFGGHYRNRYFRIGGGLDMIMENGSGVGIASGVGGSIGLDVTIPITDGFGLAFGVYASICTLLGQDGYRYEIGPGLGILLSSKKNKKPQVVPTEE
jgi:hypothetical protein